MESTKMATVGQIIHAMKTELFPGEPKNEFERKCRERERLIKQYLDTCGIICDQHIKKPGLNFDTLSYWKKERSKTCIKNICDYITELVVELDKEKIENHCKTVGLFRPIFDPDLILLSVNSYYGSVVADVYWISDLTVHEAIQIAGGKLTLEELGNRAPGRISEIKATLQKNEEAFSAYAGHIETINEAFSCYEKKYFKAFNLLLLTSIEGMVRSLGLYLVEKQKLSIDPFDKKYNSLDNFLRNIPWKEDLELSATRVTLLTGNYTRVNYNNLEVKRIDPIQKVQISLKTRLDFLRRRFKENRDLILHGQETQYNKPYHGYINASALKEVIDTILECQSVYNDK
jgi:hypothetical protein